MILGTRGSAGSDGTSIDTGRWGTRVEASRIEAPRIEAARVKATGIRNARIWRGGVGRPGIYSGIGTSRIGHTRIHHARVGNAYVGHAGIHRRSAADVGKCGLNHRRVVGETDIKRVAKAEAVDPRRDANDTPIGRECGPAGIAVTAYWFGSTDLDFARESS